LSEAFDIARKATLITPSVPRIHFVLGQVALFRGQYDEAALEALTAIELDPNCADAHALLAWILHYAGRPDQAWSALAQAVRRNPDSSASYRVIAGEIYFTQGQYPRALQEFRAALQRNPARMRARLWLAASLTKLGHDAEAAWEVQELLTINPHFSQSWLPLSFPFKDPRQQNELTEALIQLGLPE